LRLLILTNMSDSEMASNVLVSKIRELQGEADSQLDVQLPVVRSSSGAKYYAKIGSRSEQEQYVGEAESLKHMSSGAPSICPFLLSSGVTDDALPYFISEYKELSGLSTESSQKLAKRLATEMHRYKSENGKFGFHVPTFCGLTRLANGWYDTWEECYFAHIGGLLEGLRSVEGNKELCEKGELVRQRVIPFLLRGLKVEPVILHGDLWSGNTGTDITTNEPLIYDPSSFYGHNEADLAIARIFGGFSASFFSAYHDHLPKSDPVEQYEMRVDLYELFHYLNHALIFGGGGYSSSSLQKMTRLLQQCSTP